MGRPISSGPEPVEGFEGLWFLGMKPRLPGVFYAARSEARDLAAVMKAKALATKQKAAIPSPALSVQ
jgi:hypothetical protein